MSDQDVFSDNNNPAVQATPEAPAPSADPFANQLSEIRNEEGQQKYNTVEDALKGGVNAQEFIQQLKTEKASVEAERNQLRDDLSKATTLDDVVSRLTGNQTAAEVPPTVEPTGLDEQTVQNLVQKTLDSNKASEVLARNQDQVLNTLRTKYGDKAQEVVANKAKELDMSPSELGELAKKNPKMVLSMFGETYTSSQSTSSSVNIHASPTPIDSAVGRPEKSLLSGATAQDQAAFMKKIKEEVYKEHDITT